MKDIKVLSVFGTRPEAGKMAPLVLKLQSDARFNSKVCVTAQHRSMLDSVLSTFGVIPDYDLDVMAERQTLCSLSSKIISGLEGVLNEVKPDIVLVHGDTTTTVAAAFAAFYCGIKVGHVEAGLRSFKKMSPYPEEMNRIITSDIADLHFAPTVSNRENLLRENVKDNIFITGNTAIDALSYTVAPDFVFDDERINRAVNSGKKLIVLTAHRRENLGKPHENIFRAVKKLVEEFLDIIVVYPVHLNPAVSVPAHKFLNHERIILTEPMEMKQMHNLMAASHFIMTDSGGIQEEGPALGKPVLVLRRETERPEAVLAGTVRIANVRFESVYEEAKRLLEFPDEYAKMARAVNPYGDGRASARILDAIGYYFGVNDRPADFTPEIIQ